ncbi:FabD/lysophospholipase-like protein [Stemphylium lycopersici]|nr:cytosolic phospholipase a2 zeta [Stemphylium lycopersici]RAR02047.1 FabD/lysophospholipase-like protein [Stemphylium lycopersici]
MSDAQTAVSSHPYMYMSLGATSVQNISLHTKRPLSHASKPAALRLRYGPPFLLATAAATFLASERSPYPLFRPIHLDAPSLKRYILGSDDKKTDPTSAGDAEKHVNEEDEGKPGEQEAPPQTRVAKGYNGEDNEAGQSQSAWQTITDKFPKSPSPSKLGDTIIDYIVPNWVKVLPGFIRKLQNELSMAPGSLAEEIWYEANDPEINPEIIWDASVRVSDELCQEEKAFREKRAHFTKAALARYLDIPEATIHPDDVPIIAMCGSGGGLRALVAGTSSYLSTKEAGLFDCVTYTAGVSGSCWLQTLYYSELSQRSHARIIRHLKNRLGIHIAFPPDALELLVSAPTNKYLLSGLVEKAKGIPDADFGLVDIYGALLAARLLVPKGELSVSEYDFKVSNQRRFTDNGSHPLPIYTAVRHEIPFAEQADTKDPVAAEAKARKEAWFQWFEFTPYEMWCEELSAGIPTWAMGRRFENGRTVWRENGLALPEVRVPLLMGIWGSAFCATLSHYYREIRPLMRNLTGLGSSIDAMIAERDDDLVKVHPIDPAAMPNYALGMRELLPSTCPESIFSQKNFQFMDAGMSNNLPIYPLLRPGRNVDILVAFDASADVKTDNWLKVADGYARQRGIKGWPVGAGWPPADESMHDLQEDLDRAEAATETQAQSKLDEAQSSAKNKDKDNKSKDLGYCNIWVGSTEERSSDSETPVSKQVDDDWELMHPSSGITVIYFPFLANDKVPGVDPKVSDFMSTWNFVYSPQQIDSVVDLARANYNEGAERTKRTVRAVYERKKRDRENREREERERRWRWRLSQGRIAGRRVGGESEHGDQFS